jgi:hypothetical protein
LSSGWIIFASSLSSAALAAVITLSVYGLQGRRDAKAARRHSRRQAYSRLLASTGIVVHTADTLHLMMETRSGLGEGVDVLLRVRRPLDAMDLHELLRPVITTLYEAMAEVSTVGTPEAVQLGNRVVSLCADVMQAATERGQARSPAAALLRGEKWTVEQLESSRATVQSLSAARAEFAALARRELGIEIIGAPIPQDQEGSSS